MHKLKRFLKNNSYLIIIRQGAKYNNTALYTIKNLKHITKRQQAISKIRVKIFYS